MTQDPLALPVRMAQTARLDPKDRKATLDPLGPLALPARTAQTARLDPKGRKATQDLGGLPDPRDRTARPDP